jgi:hypothetical protein
MKTRWRVELRHFGLAALLVLASNCDASREPISPAVKTAPSHVHTASTSVTHTPELSPKAPRT